MQTTVALGRVGHSVCGQACHRYIRQSATSEGLYIVLSGTLGGKKHSCCKPSLVHQRCIMSLRVVALNGVSAGSTAHALSRDEEKRKKRRKVLFLHIAMQKAPYCVITHIGCVSCSHIKQWQILTLCLSSQISDEWSGCQSVAAISAAGRGGSIPESSWSGAACGDNTQEKQRQKQAQKEKKQKGEEGQKEQGYIVTLLVTCVQGLPSNESSPVHWYHDPIQQQSAARSDKCKQLSNHDGPCKRSLYMLLSVTCQHRYASGHECPPMPRTLLVKQMSVLYF